MDLYPEEYPGEYPDEYPDEPSTPPRSKPPSVLSPAELAQLKQRAWKWNTDPSGAYMIFNTGDKLLRGFAHKPGKRTNVNPEWLAPSVGIASIYGQDIAEFTVQSPLYIANLSDPNMRRSFKSRTVNQGLFEDIFPDDPTRRESDPKSDEVFVAEFEQGRFDHFRVPLDGFGILLEGGGHHPEVYIRKASRGKLAITNVYNTGGSGESIAVQRWAAKLMAKRNQV